jgi:hypothetical protein
LGQHGKETKDNARERDRKMGTELIEENTKNNTRAQKEEAGHSDADREEDG